MDLIKTISKSNCTVSDLIHFVQIASSKKPSKLPEDKFNSIKVFSERRIAELKLNNTAAYMEYLKQNKTETNKINNMIKSVIVSRFFRNPLVYEIIENIVLPELFLKNKSLRIWSAGCATGEEPYSISILCHRILSEEENKEKKVQIFATDIDQESIKVAEVASYGDSKLAETKFEIINRYFKKEKNKYVLDAGVKKMVSFSIHDILANENMYPSEAVYGGFDIIFCRNVLIYYNEGSRRKIIDNFAGVLGSGACLVLGSTEFLDESNRNKFREIVPGTRVYTKR